MIEDSEGAISRAYYFGPFRLFPEQQLLLEGDVPVKVGGRALEILRALVERPGKLVGKDELLSRAWPGIVVEASNLKVNVAALRKALGEVGERPRYIATVNGRGYRFVSPVEALKDPPANSERPQQHLGNNIPIPVSRIIGQDRTIDELTRRFGESRLLTVVGAGGIGKTTVALAVARSVAARFDHGAWLVDLAPLTDQALVAGTIAAALGLVVHSEDTNAALVTFLRDKDLMLVLDNCEHVIGAVAEIAERIVKSAGGVYILATSREPLRVGAEGVYRLAPLETPPPSADLSAAQAMTFPAIELFVERAARSAGEFVLDDANAPLVGEICRGLDGIALAIELAATRVCSLGLKTISGALGDRFRLLNQGDRTAPARQRTLYATLDWSHQLLSENERMVLQRLSVFAGLFGLEAAIAVSAFGTIGRHDVVDALANLVAKSLVSMSVDTTAQYRLLETTRAYAREKLVQRGEFAQCAAKHAEYFRDELRRAAIELQGTASSDWLLRYSRKIDDVRAALRWAFSDDGSEAFGTSLVVEAISLWSRVSLLEECRAWVERVISSPTLRSRTSERDRMKLYGAFGSALLYTRGADPQVKVALSRSLRLAERLGDTAFLMRALWGLAYYSLYIGDHQSALDLATRLQQVASAVGAAAGKRDGDRAVAAALHYQGDHARARRILARLIDDDVGLAEGPRLARFQLDHRVSVHCSLAHVMFVQGLADQARQSAEIAINEARAVGHPVSLGSALVLAAVPVALYRGDLSEADRLLTMLMDIVAKQGLVFWSAMTDCLHSALLTMKREEAGVQSLRRALEGLRTVNFGVRYPAYLGLLAHGLGATGQREEAFRTIEAAVRWSKRHEELWCLPELMRIEGQLLTLDGSRASRNAAERQFKRAIEVARRQQALSWELRAGIDLAKLWHRDGRTSEARHLLLPIYGQFSEGFETVDLRSARALLRDFAWARNH